MKSRKTTTVRGHLRKSKKGEVKPVRQHLRMIKKLYYVNYEDAYGMPKQAAFLTSGEQRKFITKENKYIPSRVKSHWMSKIK